MNRTIHNIRTLSTVALMAAATLVFAGKDNAPAGADKPITYPQIIKAIQSGHGNAKKTSDLIVGKTATVKLISTGDIALMVNRKDEIFFVCEKRVNAFKSGNVTSKISKYESPDEGEITVTLASCGV